MLTDRRSVLRDIGLIMAAPMIVRAASLMPVVVWRVPVSPWIENVEFDDDGFTLHLTWFPQMDS